MRVVKKSRLSQAFDCCLSNRGGAMAARYTGLLWWWKHTSQPGSELSPLLRPCPRLGVIQRFPDFSERGRQSKGLRWQAPLSRTNHQACYVCYRPQGLGDLPVDLG